MLDKWDKRFLELAEHISSWSKDPSTKVGAVLVSPDRCIVVHGYNGFPRKIKDSPELYNDREEKYKRIIHAEQNAINFAPVRDLKGWTLYVHPLPPCNRCALEIIQHGVSRVVSYSVGITKWKDSIKLTKQLFDEAGVTLELYHKNE